MTNQVAERLVELSPDAPRPSFLWNIVAEVKPNTRSGRYKMEGQIKGYSASARDYNKNLSNTMGLTAPAVKEHWIFYSPATGKIVQWL